MKQVKGIKRFKGAEGCWVGSGCGYVYGLFSSSAVSGFRFGFIIRLHDLVQCFLLSIAFVNQLSLTSVLFSLPLSLTHTHSLSLSLSLFLALSFS